MIGTVGVKEGKEEYANNRVYGRADALPQSSQEIGKTRCELVGTIEGGGFEKMFEEIRRVYGVNGCSPTITAKRGGGITR